MNTVSINSGLPRRKSCPPDFGAVTAAAAHRRATVRMSSPFASSIELNITRPLWHGHPAWGAVAGCVDGEKEGRIGKARATRDRRGTAGFVNAANGHPLAACDKFGNAWTGDSLTGWLPTP